MMDRFNDSVQWMHTLMLTMIAFCCLSCSVDEDEGSTNVQVELLNSKIDLLQNEVDTLKGTVIQLQNRNSKIDLLQKEIDTLKKSAAQVQIDNNKDSINVQAELINNKINLLQNEIDALKEGVPLPSEAMSPGKILQSPEPSIAFSADGEIFLINPDGTNKTNLTNHQATDLYPAWSPDGKQLAFVSKRITYFHIFVIDATRDTPTPIIIPSTHIGMIAWAPNGVQFAYEAGGYIYVVHIEVPPPVWLANGYRPTWSPDSTHIAFYNSPAHEKSGVYIISLIGGGSGHLTEGDEPAWSPDGKKIAFSSTGAKPAEHVGQPNRDIFVINVDGTRRTNLTNHPGRDATPTWSPDGRRIAFSSWRNSSFNWEIYVMNANGSNQTNITNDATVDDITPAWR